MKRFLPFLALAGLTLLTANWASARNDGPLPPLVDPTEKPVRLDYPAGAQTGILLPDGQRARIRSLLNVDRRMHYGDFIWNEANVPAGPTWIRVDLGAQTISIFRAGHEIGTAVILYGTDGYPTPSGGFRVLEKDKDHWSRSYDAPMSYMLRLTDDGVAIHASDVEKGFATHGCVGVPLAFARHLFETMSKGDSVVILASRAAKAA